MTAADGPIVVTGVAGFIGSNLAERLLADGWHVVGVDDLSQGVIEQVPAEVDFHELDIRDPELHRLIRGAAAIFHLAARNCVSDCELAPVETASVNVVGTVNVLEAAVRAGVERVIYAESSALYEGTDRFPTPEEVHAPRSVYATSKAAARAFAMGFGRARGLALTALRYFCVYGPRQDYRRTLPPVMTAFILRLLQGQQPTIFGTGEKRRDFVYVDDVNDFHVRCLADGRTAGGTFNLGAGRDHSVAEIFALVARLLDSNVEPLWAPDLPGEAERTCADIGAARALGWEPKVPLEEGIRRSIDYIRAHVLDSTAGAA